VKNLLELVLKVVARAFKIWCFCSQAQDIFSGWFFGTRSACFGHRLGLFRSASGFIL